MKQSILAYFSQVETEAQLKLLISELRLTDASLYAGGIGRATQDLSEETSPDLLIIDLNGCDDYQPALARLADVVEPGTSVILLGPTLTLAQYREIKALGIIEYFDTPLDMANLRQLCAESLGLVSARAASSGHSRIISLTGIQGGVGCTAISAAVAQLLAQQGSHTLVSELDDRFGDLNLYWSQLEANGVEIDQLNQPQLVQRTSVELAPRLDWLPLRGSADSSEQQLQLVNSLLADQYTRVVWDCNKYHPQAAAMWQQADICIWVFEASVALVEQWKKVKQQLKAGGHQRHIFVLNQTRPERAKQISAAQIEQMLDAELVVIPYCQEAPVYAANLGEANLLLEGQFGKAIAGLVDKIQLRSPQKVKKSSSVVKRLLQRKSGAKV